MVGLLFSLTFTYCYGTSNVLNNTKHQYG